MSEVTDFTCDVCVNEGLSFVGGAAWGCINLLVQHGGAAWGCSMGVHQLAEAAEWGCINLRIRMHLGASTQVSRVRLCISSFGSSSLWVRPPGALLGLSQLGWLMQPGRHDPAG